MKQSCISDIFIFRDRERISKANLNITLRKLRKVKYYTCQIIQRYGEFISISTTNLIKKYNINPQVKYKLEHFLGGVKTTYRSDT